jgi:hypothetical protein
MILKKKTASEINYYLNLLQPKEAKLFEALIRRQVNFIREYDLKKDYSLALSDRRYRDISLLKKAATLGAVYNSHRQPH